MFTPYHTLFGGTLLSLASSSLLTDTGRVFGISGITSGALWGDRASWRYATIAGLMAGPAFGRLMGLDMRYAGDALSGWAGIPMNRAVVAGLLVGLGSRLGSGCTSGHMLCGVARGSKRSIVATATFFISALVTANVFPLESHSVLKSALPVSPFTPDKTLPAPPFILIPSLLFSLFLLRLTLSRQSNPPLRSKLAPYFFYGLTFSLGLLISGMADPFKVLNFLRPFSPTFDPSLAMVMITGVLPNAFHWITTKKGQVRYPWEQWRVPSGTDIDWNLLTGAAIFGIGWGLAGVCPGPALVGFGRVGLGWFKGEDVQVVGKVVSTFMGTMLVGMGLGGLI